MFKFLPCPVFYGPVFSSIFSTIVFHTEGNTIQISLIVIFVFSFSQIQFPFLSLQTGHEQWMQFKNPHEQYEFVNFLKNWQFFKHCWSNKDNWVFPEFSNRWNVALSLNIFSLWISIHLNWKSFTFWDKYFWQIIYRICIELFGNDMYCIQCIICIVHTHNRSFYKNVVLGIKYFFALCVTPKRWKFLNTFFKNFFDMLLSTS